MWNTWYILKCQNSKKKNLFGFPKVKKSRWWARDWDSVHLGVKRFTFVIKSTGRHYRPTGLAETTKVHPFRLCHISSAHAESCCHQKEKYWHIFKWQYVRLHLFCSCRTILTCDTFSTVPPVINTSFLPWVLQLLITSLAQILRYVWLLAHVDTDEWNYMNLF